MIKEPGTTCQSSYPAFTTMVKTAVVFFAFEEDFVEEQVRCIPMIVRFKLDACGIKLKLSEWSKMTMGERVLLCEMDCSNQRALLQYRIYLQQLVMQRTGAAATDLPVTANPEWETTAIIPPEIVEKAAEFEWPVSLQKWRRLSNLQRFVLLKLCKPGHENKNFPKAYKEFGLL
ncbi:MAG: nitrate reductase associated protein [Chitinophagaceae bacterium]